MLSQGRKLVISVAVTIATVAGIVAFIAVGMVCVLFIIEPCAKAGVEWVHARSPRLVVGAMIVMVAGGFVAMVCSVHKQLWRGITCRANRSLEKDETNE